MAIDPLSVPTELIDALKTGKGVLFAGAGLSRGAGLPDWKGLLQGMLDWGPRHGVSLKGELRDLKRSITDGRMLDVAAVLRDRFGQQRYYEFLTETFRKTSLQPTENHRLIARLPFAAALTTNFDHLIEDAYAQVRGHAPRIYTQKDEGALAQLNRTEGYYVLKIHGDIDRIDTIVLGALDFRVSLFDNEAFKNYFSALWQTKTLLFLGFGLDDPDVTLRVDALAQAFGGYGSHHFALMAADTTHTLRRERLERDSNIRVIPYRPTQQHPEVTTFLRALSAAIGEDPDADVRALNIATPTARPAATVPRVDPERAGRVITEHCQRVIAANEHLDFRGILQVREILRLRLEDLYVPLWGTIEAPQAIRASVRQAITEVRTPADSPAQAPPLHPPDAVAGAGDLRAVRIEVAQALRENARLVILGDPGTGKSTILKLLALTYARGREAVRSRFGFEEDHVPILVPIAAFGEAVAKDKTLSFTTFLLQLLASDRRDVDVLRQVLGEGKAVLLLDGMDEVLDVSTRILVSRQIERFIESCHPATRVVVTSRVAGYQRVSFTGNVVHLTLLPFEDDAIRAFAKNWAEAYERSANPIDYQRRADQRVLELNETIVSRPDIRRLATNPLMVTILALIQQQGRRLPNQRVELYRLCVEALAEHWQRARSLYVPIDLYLGGRRLDERYIVGVLAPIAFWLFETRPTGLLHRNELELRIAEQLVEREGVKPVDAPTLANNFIELIREQSGLLIERGADLFDFLHPTFKEYLAARHLAERRDPLKLLGQHLFEPRWREVMLLTAGILKGDYLDDFLEGILSSIGSYEHLLHRALILAARCLADDVSPAERLRRQILDDLFAVWMTTPVNPLRSRITDLFSECRGSAVAAEIYDRCVTLAAGRQSAANIRSVAAYLCGRLGETSRAEQMLKELADGDSIDVRSRCDAAEMLSRLGVHQEAADRLLRFTNRRDWDPDSRSRAAYSLVNVAKAGGLSTVLMHVLHQKTFKPGFGGKKGVEGIDEWTQKTALEALVGLAPAAERATLLRQLSTRVSKELRIDVHLALWFATRDEHSARALTSTAAAAEYRWFGAGYEVTVTTNVLIETREGDGWVWFANHVESWSRGMEASSNAPTFLCAILDDVQLSARVRAEAARALGSFNRPEVRAKLTTRAEETTADYVVRLGSAAALAALGDPSAARLLSRVDAERPAWLEPEDLTQLAVAFRQSGDAEQAKNQLLELVRSDGDDWSSGTHWPPASTLLHNWGYKAEVIELVLKQLQQESPWNAHQAVTVARTLAVSDTRVLHELARMVESTDSEYIRDAAWEALVECSQATVIG